MALFRFARFSAIALVCAGIAGCMPANTTISTSPAGAPAPSGGGTSSLSAAPVKPTTPSFAQFTDIPMPDKARMVLESSRVLGSDENWTGWVTLDAEASAVLMYDFYQREMPKFGWAKVTTVRGSLITLVYDRDGRVATINILDRGSDESRVELTVAPKG